MDAVNKLPKTTSSSSKFSHPLLQLMPYRSDVSRSLLMLQEAVNELFDRSRSEEDRIASTIDFKQRIARLDVTHQHQLVAEVIERVAKEIPSPVISEQLALAYMRRDNLEVLYENSLPTRIEWVDPSQRSGKSAVAFAAHYVDASFVWSDAVNALLSMSSEELSVFSERNAAAAIRMLQLHILYGAVATSVTKPLDRLQFMEGPGLSIWSALLKSLERYPANLALVQDMLGRSAQIKVWHRLNGQVHHRELVATTTVPVGDIVGPDITPSQHLVILDPIQPSSDPDHQDSLRRYESLRQPVPIKLLPGVSEINAIEDTLVAEFPWAPQAIIGLTSELRTRRLFGATELGLTPTLLVGEPGCGKTRLVRRIAEELKVPLTLLSLAGMPDAKAIQGTSRGWSTGEASPLISRLLRNMTASAIIQLDEIDKSTHQTSNSPPVTSALLDLLEPENSKRYLDNYLQATCDLSKLVFIATANALSPLPRPLLSRFRIIRVPSPSAEHFPTIAREAARDLFQEWGLPAEGVPSLNLHERPASAMSAREIREFIRRALAEWAKENLGPGRTH